MKADKPSGNNISGLLIILHITCLSALVVAKPVYDLFSAYPEYFVINNIQAWEIYLWLVSLSLILPFIIAALLVIVGLLSKRLQYIAYAICVSFFIGLFILLSFQYGTSESPYTEIAVAMTAIIVSLAILVLKPQASFGITLLSPVIIIFPLLFIFDPSVQRVLTTDDATSQGGIKHTTLQKTPPIFFVVFDELSLIDLLDAKGAIDATRYPNIAAFAKASTWYSNATTVIHSTTSALPAILTGKWPNTNLLPRYEDYPQNLFSLLEDHYYFNVVEPVTHLSSHASDRAGQRQTKKKQRLIRHQFLEDTLVLYSHLVVPGGLTYMLPPIDTKWGGFLDNETDTPSTFESLFADPDTPPANSDGESARSELRKLLKTNMKSDRVQVFRDFTEGFSRQPSSTLHFLHILLPHRPLIYAPSGRQYTKSANIRGAHVDKKSRVWVGSQRTIDKMHQRHLLQTGFVDTLWGLMINKIKSIGLYNESLIILVADHGISYQANTLARRVSPENFADVAFIPLLIKYPNQKSGKTDESNVEIIDILPTLADVLGVETDWSFDGRSLLDNSTGVRPIKTLPATKGKVLKYSRKEYLAAREAAISRHSVAFRLSEPNATLFNYEAGLELIGVAFNKLTAQKVPCVIHSETLDSLLSTGGQNPNPPPIRITGELNCPKADSANLLLLIVAHGKVVSTTRPYLYEGGFVFDHVLSHQDVLEIGGQAEIFIIDYKPAERVQKVQHRKM